MTDDAGKAANMVAVVTLLQFPFILHDVSSLTFVMSNQLTALLICFVFCHSIGMENLSSFLRSCLWSCRKAIMEFERTFSTPCHTSAKSVISSSVAPSASPDLESCSENQPILR